MTERIPPLTALRAFDAAARHMSFSKAAEELSVTAAALSFQIKSLEEHLGAPLFRRLNRAVELTEAGRALAPGSALAFEELHRAWTAAKRSLDTTRITVTAGPAITAKWLAPRLFEFARAHPEIELRFSATLKLVDFKRDDVDVAIRFGLGGPDEGLYSKPIIREWMTPMMSPALAAEISAPEDLFSATLLQDFNLDFLDPPCDWRTWFRAAGLDGDPPGGPVFSQADHAIDAAEGGGGVVLGRASLTTKALEHGRLVIPFPIAITTEAHYRVLCPSGVEQRPQVAAFLSWLDTESKETGPRQPGLRYINSKDLPP
jgi:LysR family glycine cleavage system transcriptional activator